MKIPLEWLKKYVNTSKSTKEIADSFTSLGLMLDKPVETNNEMEVLDLEHRMDRADWLAILGCARDFAAFEKIELIKPKFATDDFKTVSANEKINIEVKGEGFVNRFKTRVFKNVKNENSPEWIKKSLEAYGIPSRNLIVDITNYVMVELGQPMHAHDLNKMETRDIVFRKAKKGEKITTLLGETVELDESIWIYTNNDKPAGIAGIVGGKMVAIDDSTTDILLDSGSYDQTTIRKSSRALKIYNETVLRYDKFLHPRNNELAINRATQLILELGGDNVEVYENGDYFPNKERWTNRVMELRNSRLRKIAGFDINFNEALETLERIEYKVLESNENSAKIEVPFFRTDVDVEDDLVADVLRLYDYKKIKIEPIATFPPKDNTSEIYKFENEIRDVLVRIGCHEHITDPLVEADENSTNQVKLQNALTSEKSALRNDIFQTLEITPEAYIKNKISKVDVFEVGLEYIAGNEVSEEKYSEDRVVAVISRNENFNSYELSKHTKEILATLFRNIGIKDYHLRGGGENNSDKTYIYTKDVNVGLIEHDRFKIYTKELVKCDRAQTLRVTNEISNVSTEDITLVGKINIPFGPIHAFISEYAEQIIKVTLEKEYISEENLGKDVKAITFEITLKKLDMSDDFTQIRENLLSDLEKEFDISIRK